MSTSNFWVGPQDDWVQVVTGPTNQIRITGVPHTHPFQVYGGSSAPTAADTGITVCHKPFHLNVAGNADSFYVKLINEVPNAKQMDGRLRLDVYIQPGP